MSSSPSTPLGERCMHGVWKADHCYACEAMADQLFANPPKGISLMSTDEYLNRERPSPSATEHQGPPQFETPEGTLARVYENLVLLQEVTDIEAGDAAVDRMYEFSKRAIVALMDYKKALAQRSETARTKTEGSCYSPDETRPADYYDHLSPPSAIAPSADEKRYRWLRRNGDKGIYVIQRWTQGDEHPPLALAQGGELDTIIDEHIAGTR